MRDPAQMLAAVPDSYQKTIGYPTDDWLAGAAIPTAEVSLDLEEAKPSWTGRNLDGEELGTGSCPTGLERLLHLRPGRGDGDPDGEWVPAGTRVLRAMVH